MRQGQNYISSELTHFLGRGLSQEEQYTLMIKIVKEGVLKTKKWPDNVISSQDMDMSKSFSTNELFNNLMVCFCDIPLSEMCIHMNKYSSFGLAFKKEFLLKKGVNPVNYIDINSQMQNESWINLFDKFAKKINKYLNNELIREDITSHDSMEIVDMRFFIETYIMSYIKFFDSLKEESDSENYYMEREWRSLTKVDFKLKDVCRIIIPVSYLKKFLDEFPEYSGHISTL